MIFQWQGINKAGQRIQGTTKANSKIEFIKKIESLPMTLLSFKKQYPSFSIKEKRISLQKIANFTHEFYIILKSGISIPEAITLLLEGCQDKMQPILQEIKIKIDQGQSFSQALRSFPSIFDNIYCDSVAAGEHSGKLKEVLLEIYQYQNSILQLRKKIYKALFYPTIVLSLALIITCGLLLFVIPQFELLLQNLHGTLPLLTRVILNCSHLLRHHIGLIFSTTIIFIFLISFILHSNKSKNFIQMIIIKIPLFKKIFMATAILRWAQILTTTLEADITLIEALKLSNAVLKIPIFNQIISETVINITHGLTFHQSLNPSVFPKKIIRLIALGENMGLLTLMFRRICELYKEDLNNWLEKLSQLLEPAIMILLSIFIALLIIGMYIPIFKIGQTL